MDNNKISHKDKRVVKEQMSMILRHFGNLSITRGDKFDFLGMQIELKRDTKQIHITMVNHLKEAIELFREDLKDNVSFPAYRDLFTTFHDMSKELNTCKSDIFHRVTAKLLFITKRA